jgi:hypothetical protein
MWLSLVKVTPHFSVEGGGALLILVPLPLAPTGCLVFLQP